VGSKTTGTGGCRPNTATTTTPPAHNSPPNSSFLGFQNRRDSMISSVTTAVPPYSRVELAHVRTFRVYEAFRDRRV